MKPFLVAAGETPTECPSGHKTDDSELTVRLRLEADAQVQRA